MNETVPEKDPWAEVADELERIAADARKLIGQPAPCSFSLNIQPYTPDQIKRAQPKHFAETVEAADAVASALLGKTATTYQLSGGGFHHGADARRGRIEVRIYQAVADPAEVDPREEIARLRAENARLRAALPADPTGLAYSRADEADDPTPVSPARVPLHTGAVTDEGLVEELAVEAVHMVLADGIRYCGGTGPGSHVWREVTCPDCISKGKS